MTRTPSDTIPPALITVRKCDPRATSHSEWATLSFEGETLGVVQAHTDKRTQFELHTNWDERFPSWRTSTLLLATSLDAAVRDALDWMPIVSQRVTSCD